MAKHVWEIKGSFDDIEIVSDVSPDGFECGPICRMQIDDEEESLRYAHLIAAAPDMYEVLRGLVDSIQRGDDYPESAAQLDRAVKAIAKAEGRNDES